MSYQNDWRWNPQWKKAHLVLQQNHNDHKRYFVMACGKVYSSWYTGYGGKYSNLGIRCEKCSLVATMNELAQ